MLHSVTCFSQSVRARPLTRALGGPRALGRKDLAALSKTLLSHQGLTEPEPGQRRTPRGHRPRSAVPPVPASRLVPLLFPSSRVTLPAQIRSRRSPPRGTRRRRRRRCRTPRLRRRQRPGRHQHRPGVSGSLGRRRGRRRDRRSTPRRARRTRGSRAGSRRGRRPPASFPRF